MTPAQAATYHRQYLRWHTSQERKAKRAVLSRFRQMMAPMLNALEQSGPTTLLGIVDMLVTPQVHQSILQAIYLQVGIDAAQREYDRLLPQKSSNLTMLTKDKDPIPLPQAPKPGGLIRIGFFSEQWRAKMVALAQSSETAERVTKMTQRTRQLIRDVLSEGIDKRFDIRKIGRNLRIAVVDPVRALLIARTETTRASSAGHEAGAMSTNLLLNKKWIATADTRTRPDHLAMLSAQPVARDGVFIVGGMLMRFPGDPAGGAAQVCNCRCTIAYVPARDYLN